MSVRIARSLSTGLVCVTPTQFRPTSLYNAPEALNNPSPSIIRWKTSFFRIYQPEFRSESDAEVDLTPGLAISKEAADLNYQLAGVDVDEPPDQIDIENHKHCIKWQFPSPGK